jgi:hypothetical protein
MLFVVVAAAVVALAMSKHEARCPVTGSILTPQQLADPSLRVGGKTVCCKDCKTKYARGM